MAHAARRLLLSVYRPCLRRDDLEDCYSQATVELVAQARRGELRYSSRTHLGNLFELRFVSRVRDRRRALRGRSPAQAMLDGALSLGGVGQREVEIADPRADVERRTLLRFDLRSVELAAPALSPDQRLVLACQIGLQMGAGEFCRRFGWSHEKHRKVAQRARAKLRRLVDESVADVPAGGRPAGGGSVGVSRPVRSPVEGGSNGVGRPGASSAGGGSNGVGRPGTSSAGGGDQSDAATGFLNGGCPAFPGGSGERVGTHL